MKPSPARDLARRYAAGELSLDEYRAHRRELIEAVTTGKQTLEYGQTSHRRKKQPRLRWLILIPLGVVVIAGIATSLWSSHSRGLHQPGYLASTHVESGSDLVSSFVETNDWNDASIEQFLQHWNKLSRREQTAAYRSYIFPRLISQLQEQIVSQRAMLELAPDRQIAGTHLNHLRQMAAVLKVNTEN